MAAPDGEESSPLEPRPAAALPLSLITKETGAITKSTFESVVKVFCVKSPHNHFLPWQRLAQSRSSASGFIISGRRILTNAHAVQDHSFVAVRKHASPKKYTARVIDIGYECDLAVLTVEDPTFWEKTTPLVLGGIPKLQDAVVVIGYPVGGDNISITAGVVSRVDIREYTVSASRLPVIQIDAAINHGNSGGPALQHVDGRWEVVGVAGISKADGIGYIIPIPVVSRFLSDMEKHGRYTGFAETGLYLQSLENASMKKMFGVPPERSGVVINKISPLSPSASAVVHGDVIMAINGIPVADDGSVEFRDGERIEISYLYKFLFPGDTINLTIMRDHKEISVPFTLDIQRLLVPWNWNAPTFYIVAGLVFVPLTRRYLQSAYGKDWQYKGPITLVAKLRDPMKNPDEQVVILSQVLSADINKSYENFAATIVKSVNGNPINNLKAFAAEVEQTRGEFLKILLDGEKLIVIEKAQAVAVLPQILKQHSIPSHKSDQL